MLRPALLALALVAATTAGADPWQGARAAFFGISLIDTSAEGAINGVRPDETARIEATETYVANELRGHGLVLVDLAPVRDELARTLNPARCNDCDLRMARALGADYAVVAEVQKVSNLILSMNLYVRDAATGALVRGQSIDIRGNTDDSWRRGMRAILERNVFVVD